MFLIFGPFPSTTERVEHPGRKIPLASPIPTVGCHLSRGVPNRRAVPAASLHVRIELASTSLVGELARSKPGVRGHPTRGVDVVWCCFRQLIWPLPLSVGVGKQPDRSMPSGAFSLASLTSARGNHPAHEPRYYLSDRLPKDGYILAASSDSHGLKMGGMKVPDGLGMLHHVLMWSPSPPPHNEWSLCFGATLSWPISSILGP